MRDSVTVIASVDAPIDVVWRFLTAERNAWWPDMRFEAVVGSRLVETWVEEGREASATGSITRCEAPHTLGFRWNEEGWECPLDVLIVLVEKGMSTAVTLTESGFAAAQTPPALPAQHDEGWRYHLVRLKRVSEGNAVEAC